MSVYKDRSCGRDRWVVQIYKDGHKIRFYTDPKRGLPLLSKEDAKKAEAEITLRGAPKASDGPKKTPCRDLKNAFFDQLRKNHKPSTIYTRLNFYENYVAPLFDPFNVEDLTNDDLDRFNERLNKAPRGSMCNVVSTAKAFIEFLRKWNGSLLPERIFPYLDPYPHNHEYHFYTLEQERQFLSVIGNQRDRLLFTLFCYYGFRMTECIALKYSDIDVQRNTISISRIVLTKSTFKKQIFTTPKTKRSIRTLALLPCIIDLLDPEADLSGFLFPGEHGAQVINEGHVRRLAKQYAAKAGLYPIKIHEFRHSCASNLIRNGMPLRIVAQWLGDTESTVLDYYSHMFPDESQSVAKFFESHPLEETKGPKNGSGNSGPAMN